jgi:hypothetical protein
LLGLKATGPLGLLLLGVGCAPALSSFTPAHVAPKKHVQAEAGFDVSIPSSIADVVDQAATISKNANGHQLTREEQQQLFRAGAGLALNPPSFVTHVGLSYTALEHFEVNGRLTSGAWRLGGRYQVLDETKHSVDGTFSLGGGHYSYEFPVSDQIPLLTLEDFSRWQLDAGFLVGKHGDWYRWWAGPRLLVSFYGTELTFEQPAVGVEAQKKVLASLDGAATYLGGQVGAALGYKHVFVGFELTLAKFWTSASVKVLDDERDMDLDSFIVYPGIALMFEL